MRLRFRANERKEGANGLKLSPSEEIAEQAARAEKGRVNVAIANALAGCCMWDLCVSLLMFDGLPVVLSIALPEGTAGLSFARLLALDASSPKANRPFDLLVLLWSMVSPFSPMSVLGQGSKRWAAGRFVWASVLRCPAEDCSAGHGPVPTATG